MRCTLPGLALVLLALARPALADSVEPARRTVSVEARFVERGRTERLLSAPRLVLFDRQQGQLSILSQRAYVSSWKPDGTVRDPVIGTYQDGLYLELRPAISSDGRAIVLETSLALWEGTLQAVPTEHGQIEVPRVRLVRRSFSAQVTDGGTHVVAGLPLPRPPERPGLLARIPLLGRLWGPSEPPRLEVRLTARIVSRPEGEAPSRPKR